jgi:hypothetical protein
MSKSIYQKFKKSKFETTVLSQDFSRNRLIEQHCHGRVVVELAKVYPALGDEAEVEEAFFCHHSKIQSLWRWSWSK